MAERPEWLRIRAPSPEDAAGIRRVRGILAKYHLNTVCQGAACPNASQCWAQRTATFMILGNTCTRACRFCAVPTGNPNGLIDVDEPQRVAGAVAELGLRYVVLTSVDRDDLDDGGSSVFAETVRAIHNRVADVRIEALIPDFSGDVRGVDRVLEARVDVLGHNLETVRRLSMTARDPRAGYDQSLRVLERAGPRSTGCGATKSGLMLGLGESDEEIAGAMRDLRAVGVDILTLGQYLQPTPACLPVQRYVPPAEFDALAALARDLGFSAVVSGPLVRSSYKAAEAFETACGR